jgi:hypothetical protein
MLQQLLTGVGLVLALMLGWLAVQRAWARAFGAEGGDALAGRTGCAGAACARACDGRRCASGERGEEGSA